MELLFRIRLKKLRQEKNLTQKELADKLNEKQSTISHWEQGKQEPSMQQLYNMAKFFDVSIDYLFGILDYSLLKIMWDRIIELSKGDTEESRKFKEKSKEFDKIINNNDSVKDNKQRELLELLLTEEILKDFEYNYNKYKKMDLENLKKYIEKSTKNENE